MEPVKKLENDEVIVEIYYDEDCTSPRDWDNVGTMCCFHKRYNLGDKHEFTKEFISQFKDFEAFENYLIKEKNLVYIMPIYLLDHGVIRMSVRDFGDPWDSGMVGFIYASKEKVLSNYNSKWKVITEKRKKLIKAHLIAEVEEYDMFLSGDAYGYKAISKQTHEEIDSCWGFLGLDHIMENLNEQYKNLEEI